MTVSDKDQLMTEILTKMNSVALVGASANPARASHQIMAFLLDKGFDVVPVNPGLAGQELLGQTVVASLAEIERQIDWVDVFRASDAALSVTQQALAEHQRLGIKAIWMQLGVINHAAADLAEAEGLKVIMDRCPKIEWPRLNIETLRPA